MPGVLTVNLARPRPNAVKPSMQTGIDKAPAAEAVAVAAPGPMEDGAGSGLTGDTIGNTRVHGGNDQAVYAYAREDLDDWEVRLDRSLANGCFGENLTTAGLDLTDARIGERWHVGSDGLVLEVTSPRIPCAPFAGWMGVSGWIKTFTQAGKPGAYLRVIAPGQVRSGDSIVVAERPAHDVTIGLVFRALMGESELMGKLLKIDALPEHIKSHAHRRVASSS